MKKILAIALIAVSLTSCDKEYNEQRCWVCTNTKSTTNDDGTTTTVEEEEEKCGMTPEEIHVYERRYTARTLLKVTYGDKTCTELPETE